MAKTVALYLTDESLRSHTTKITSVQPVSALSEAARLLFKNANETDTIVSTAETIFYAQGGGQPSDTGTISSKARDVKFSITTVRNGPDGQILHLGHYNDSTGSDLLSVGDEVDQHIDAERRTLNSRIHTAGHVVGLAVHHLQESIPGMSELKAQHYPDSSFVEFKGLIDGKHKDAIQSQATAFVQQALPIKIYWLDREELEKKCVAVPDAVPLTGKDLIRAVDIVGAGAYPCGGTHVPDTSQVGELVIRKISRQKGISKISYAIT